MRPRPRSDIEPYREKTGPRRSRKGDRFGLFHYPIRGTVLRIIASDGSDWAESGLPGDAWEHVSVSTQYRTPMWAEMVVVKDIFWRPDELVLQFHPPKQTYVNVAEHCLHLWKPPFTVELPPIDCV